MINYAVVGTGFITEEFIKGAQLVKGLRLACVCSRNREKGTEFARRFSCKNVVTTIEELVAFGIDAVYIASPNSLHFAQSLFFLENDINVLCEKPATLNSGEILKLQTLAKERSLVYLEAMMFLYSPRRFLLEEALKKVGKIRAAHFDFSQYSSRYKAYLQGENPNIFNPQMGGGSLMDLGCYCICPSVYFWGRPKAVKGSAVFLENGVDSNGGALLEYGDFLASLSYSKTGQSRGVSQIIGDLGSLTIDSISQLTGMELYLNTGSRRTIAGALEKHITMSYEAQAFYDYIRRKNFEDKDYIKSCGCSLMIAEVSEKIRRSAAIDLA